MLRRVMAWPAALRGGLFVLEAGLLAITLVSAAAYTREYLPHLRRAMEE